MSRFLPVVLALVFAHAGSFSSAQAAHAAKHVGDAEAGQATFQHLCGMCHAVTPDTKIVGPSLYSEMRGPHARSAAQVRQVIVNGKGLMPALGPQLSDVDLANLLAYIRTK